IYIEEWKWRLEQFPGLEGVTKPVPDRLPRVDPTAQEMRLRYWQDVLHKLDDVPRPQLSPEEQINYDVYRPEIENFVADQKFRDSTTFPPTVKVGRFIVKSWARKWGCTKRHTSASACSVIRSGARRDWWWTPAFIRKVGRANRRSSICTITPRYPSTRSKPRWTVTSPGPGRPSLITWASSRSCVPAKRRRKRSERMELMGSAT